MSVSRETLVPGVSRETLERLDQFVKLLKTWNARINLVGKLTDDDFWSRHIVDCAQLAPLIPAGTPSFADLGSGAGLPGMVLAIVSGVRVHLIEADQRKAAFLREAARLTGADATIHPVRIEHAAIERQDVVTARALAPLPQLLAWSAPLLLPTGICLFLKGARADVEIEEASRAWTMRVERFISRTDRSGVILRLSEVARV